MNKTIEEKKIEIIDFIKLLDKLPVEKWENAYCTINGMVLSLECENNNKKNS